MEEKEEKKRFLDSVLVDVEEHFKPKVKGTHWTSNSHWAEAICSSEIDITELAEHIIKYIKTNIKEYKPKYLIPDEKRLKQKDYLIRRTHITLTRHEDKKNELYIDSNEVFTERLLCYVKNDGRACGKYWNQYKVGMHYKEAVDIRIKCGNKYKLVELKVLNDDKKADNPFFAIVESIKNYYLYQTPDDINELIVLAPIDYWKQYLNKTVFDKLMQFIKAVEKTEPKVKISLQYIKCGCDYLEKFSEIVNGKEKEFKFEEKISENEDKSKRKYTHAANKQLKDIVPWLSKFNLTELLTEHNLKLSNL